MAPVYEVEFYPGGKETRLARFIRVLIGELRNPIRGTLTTQQTRGGNWVGNLESVDGSVFERVTSETGHNVPDALFDNEDAIIVYMCAMFGVSSICEICECRDENLDGLVAGFQAGSYE